MASILVVDDDPFISKLLIDIVEDAGHTAIPAGNGKEAFEFAQQYQPRLIISDIRMPILDGLKLLQKIRAEPSLANTEVIFISANANKPKYLDRATIFIAKPFDVALLDTILQQLS